TTKPCGGRRKNPPAVIGRSADEGQEPTAVGVADRRYRPVGTADGEEEVEHALDTLADHRGDGDPVSRRENQEVEVDLDRVALIARGLLEVDAVGKDLPLALLNQNLGRAPAPACRPPALGQHHARIEETKRFAGEMCI